MDGALAALHNGGVLAGSREDSGDPADPPQSVVRSAPAVLECGGARILGGALDGDDSNGEGLKHDVVLGY